MCLHCSVFNHLIDYPAFLFHVSIAGISPLFFPLPVELNLIWHFISWYSQLRFRNCSLCLHTFKESLLASCVLQSHSHSCLPGYEQSSITCIQLQTTNRLKYSPEGGFCAVRPSSARKMKRQNTKSNRPDCPSITDSLYDSELFVPVRADTVVVRNVVWACDNISQTTKHWKQTNEATYCIDLLIWQIALEWVSPSSNLWAAAI